MNVYSDFTVPAFGHHITVLIYHFHNLDLLNTFVHPLSLLYLKRIYEMYSRMRVPLHVRVCECQGCQSVNILGTLPVTVIM
jgi:hypothetical protein